MHCHDRAGYLVVILHFGKSFCTSPTPAAVTLVPARLSSASLGSGGRCFSRTVQIRGDQTLEDLHHAIFDAFDREEEHMYEFQFGTGPMDPDGPRYVLPGAYETDAGERTSAAGRVDTTTIGSLNLAVGRSFGYWFDFGDDWWHQINVEAVDERVPKGKFPKVTKRVGKSPPQYDEDAG